MLFDVTRNERLILALLALAFAATLALAFAW
jgi:hypothetical protein